MEWIGTFFNGAVITFSFIVMATTLRDMLRNNKFVVHRCEWCNKRRYFSRGTMHKGECAQAYALTQGTNGVVIAHAEFQTAASRALQQGATVAEVRAAMIDVNAFIRGMRS